MPKKSADFPARLDFFVSKDTRRTLIAIAYHLGYRGVYAKAARLLLDQVIEKYIDDLPPREKVEFNKIMSNVLIQEGEKLP